MQKCAIHINLQSPLNPLAQATAVFTKVSLAKYTSQRVCRQHFPLRLRMLRRDSKVCMTVSRTPRVVSRGNRRRRVSGRFDDFAEWRTHSPYGGETMPRTNLRFRERRGWARDRCIALSYACHSESLCKLPLLYSRMRMIGDQWSPSVRAKPFRMILLPHSEDNTQFICKSHFAKLSLEMICV